MAEKFATSSTSLNVFKQPKPFYLIFSCELWERFGFYGLQAIIAIYLVRHLGMTEGQAISLFSAFSALVYSLTAVGGWLGDRVLGTKRMVIIGLIVMMIGYTIIALHADDRHLDMIYLGMATLAVGTVLFKANPASLLANCYAKDDPRLDGAYTMFYMSINIGSLISTMLTPWVAGIWGWNAAFALSVLGMVVTLVSFLLGLPILKHYGSRPDFAPIVWHKLLLTLISIVLLVWVSTWLLQHQRVANVVLALVAIIIIAVFVKETCALQGVARRRMIVAFLLMLEAVVFYVLYSQMPTSLNFFAIRNVEHAIFGIPFLPEQYQALNPFWIMIFSPLLAVVYNHLGDRLPLPHKFAIGMVTSAAAFLVLPVGAYFANAASIVSIFWLILSYALQAIGEIMISGLGLSMIVQLIPQRMMGFIMGAWFLTTAGAAIIAGKVAGLMAIPKEVVDAQLSLAIYSHVFLQIGIVVALVAILMLVTASRLQRMIQ